MGILTGKISGPEGMVTGQIGTCISLQRKAYEKKACRYQLHCVRVLPARELGKRCKLDKYNAYLQGEFTAGPPPLLPPPPPSSPLLPPPPPPIKNQCWWVRMAQLLTCPVDLFENNKKVTPTTDCSFLYVCFLMVGTYSNRGLRV